MSSANKRPTVDVVGGTYREICIDPTWEQIYGSGLRASLVIKSLDSACPVTFHTIAEKEVGKHLEMHYQNIVKDVVPAPSCATPISFVYQNTLKPPVYYINRVDYPRIDVQTENCILFGMMESIASVEADYVVYDPQSPNDPKPFSKTCSRANHLCLILNEQEARVWTGKETDSDIRDYLFGTEGCECLVIKKGASGAIVFDSPKSEGVLIPIYKTNHVWTIGSGDVFTGAFGYFWMIAHETPEICAQKASLAVACYSDSKSIENLSLRLSEAHFNAHIPKGSGLVYLAGPFFNMAERMFVNECRDALLRAGLSVFSPFHDVGLGGPYEVVPKDIEAINKCKTIFAILDGMDPGTVFEVGYGVALKKNIVVLAEHETKTHLQMMYGTNCCVETDFETAIYKTCWLTNE